MEGYYIALSACIFSMIVLTIQYVHIRYLQRTAERQQDTIDKLLNREPVTYAETGTQPQKQDKTVYAAWGSQMVNIDEEESRS